MGEMRALSPEEIEDLRQPRRGGRPPAGLNHPLGFLRKVRSQLGDPPYDPVALLELAKAEPGFYQVTRHPVLDPQALVEYALRLYAGQVCSEVYEVTYQDENANWQYDDPDGCDLDRLADHLVWRRHTDESREESFERLKDIAAQRALEERGVTVETLLAEADSRYNERRDDVAADIQVVNGE